jgi:hypothetical protein
MSKETEEKQPPLRTGDPRLTTKEVPMPHIAYGVAQDVNGKWQTFEVSYNSVTGTAKVANTHPAQSKGEAVERFKILVGQSNILD